MGLANQRADPSPTKAAAFSCAPLYLPPPPLYCSHRRYIRHVRPKTWTAFSSLGTQRQVSAARILSLLLRHKFLVGNSFTTSLALKRLLL